MRPRPLRLAALLLSMMAVSTPALAADGFYLKDGDRVVFYGDSITDQRLYTVFTETFVVTRFPTMNVTFVHSGWGGDSVNGGGGGKIDTRLERDVFAYKPTVMTVMLGMNDARYRAFDQKIFDTYSKGYEHIVDSVKSHVPGIRMTLIQPSPYDDVTRAPNFEGGYNAVLVRYGDFLKDLAKKNGLDVADLNTSVVEATQKAFAADPDHAKNLNPDRVHPSPSGQLLMAAALLKAWNAPAAVSAVAIQVDDDKAASKETKTKLSDLKMKDGTLTWTQVDEALPFAIDQKDASVALAMRSSDVIKELDQQPLKVQGLASGDYVLQIDGKEVGKFTAAELAEGVNLATLPTPMVQQAAKVHTLTVRHNNLHFLRWRQIQVPPLSNNAEHIRTACDALDAIEADMVKEQRAAAKPMPHTFELSRKS